MYLPREFQLGNADNDLFSFYRWVRRSNDLPPKEFAPALLPQWDTSSRPTGCVPGKGNHTAKRDRYLNGHFNERLEEIVPVNGSQTRWLVSVALGGGSPVGGALFMKQHGQEGRFQVCDSYHPPA